MNAIVEITFNMRIMQTAVRNCPRIIHHETKKPASISDHKNGGLLLAKSSFGKNCNPIKTSSALPQAIAKSIQVRMPDTRTVGESGRALGVRIARSTVHASPIAKSRRPDGTRLHNVASASHKGMPKKRKIVHAAAKTRQANNAQRALIERLQ